MSSSSTLHCWNNCLQNRDGEGEMIECDKCGTWVHRRCFLDFKGWKQMPNGWREAVFIGPCCQVGTRSGSP